LHKYSTKIVYYCSIKYSGGSQVIMASIGWATHVLHW